MLIASGVPRRDRADVEQVVMLGAWRSIKPGLYRPDPKAAPRKALRRWLRGIAWRHASHYRESAYVRHVVLSSEPAGLLPEPIGLTLEAQIAAREELEVLAELPPWQLEALLVVDAPETLVAWAKARGMNPSTVASRLRITCETLALLLRRRE